MESAQLSPVGSFSTVFRLSWSGSLLHSAYYIRTEGRDRGERWGAGKGRRGGCAARWVRPRRWWPTAWSGRWRPSGVRQVTTVVGRTEARVQRHVASWRRRQAEGEKKGRQGSSPTVPRLFVLRYPCDMRCGWRRVDEGATPLTLACVDSDGNALRYFFFIVILVMPGPTQCPHTPPWQRWRPVFAAGNGLTKAPRGRPCTAPWRSHGTSRPPLFPSSRPALVRPPRHTPAGRRYRQPHHRYHHHCRRCRP